MQVEMERAGEKNAEAAYSIGHSLRFRDSSSAYMEKTFASSTSNRRFTLSFWVKRSKFLDESDLFSANNTGAASVYFHATLDTLYLVDNSTGLAKSTTQVFRDPSAWMHVVVAADSTLASSSLRDRLYINGEEVTAWTLNTPSTQYADYYLASNVVHRINSYNGSGGMSDIYLSDYYYVDGQQLDPTSFGETSTTTGTWIPKAYSGTYGNNGFHLDFTDGSSTTTLGYDSAGSNDWTTYGLSASSTVSAYDWMTDTPTKNFATLNPLDKYASNITLSNGNLRAAFSTNYVAARSTMFVSSGSWYVECTAEDVTDNGYCGVATSTEPLTSGAGAVGTTAGWGLRWDANSYETYHNGMYASSYSGTPADGDVYMMAFNMDTGKIWWGRNGTWFASGDPENDMSEAYSSLSGEVSVMVGGGTSGALSVNFGQQPFKYTPPAGFNTLSTDNLPEPAILKPSDHFDVSTYTGNGSYQMFGSLYSNPAPSYDIQKSLRFRRSAPSYLSRTFTTPTDGKKWTWSGWIKRGELYATNNYQFLMATEGSGAQGFIGFGLANNADELSFGYGGFYRRYTKMLFRDPSAWQHVVLKVDTATTTEANRAVFYINGVEASMVTPTTITQNDTTQINQAVSTLIGNQTGQPYGRYDGHLANVHFVDGEALPPSAFGQEDATTGAWVPKAYAGSYGYDYTRWITPTTTGNIWTGAAYMTVDEDTSTNFGWNYSRNVATGTTAQWDIDLGTARSIGKWRIFNNDSTYSLPSWKLQYSTNGSSYTDVTTLTTAAGAWSEYSFTTAIEARYWRILPGSNGGDANAFGFREVELIDTSASYYGSNGFYLPFATTTSTTSHSIYFDGSDDYLSIADNDAFDFGTGAFTTEGWLQFERTNDNNIFGRYNIGSPTYGMLEQAGTTAYWYYGNGASYTFAIATPTIGRWYHYAISRDGSSNLRFFIDGVQQGSTQTDTTNYDGTVDYIIGKPHSGATGFQGSVSNFRVLKGTALYTSNFTATMTPLANIASTSILTAQNSTIIDNSTNAFSITTNGNPVVQWRSPFDGNLLDDASGNNADWRSINIGTTSSSTSYDIMEDTPTDNYTTWNPLDKHSSVTVADGNLYANYTGATDAYGVRSTMSVSTGKWYAEFEVTGLGGSFYPLIGIARGNSLGASNNYLPEVYYDVKAGTSYNYITTSSGPSGSAFSDGDTLAVAYDVDNQKIFFGRIASGSSTVNWMNGGDPVAGTGYFFDSLTQTPFEFGIGVYSNRTAYANFGQRPFKAVIPTGFSSLKSTNLTAPTTFDPGLVWIKNRTTSATNHGLYDTSRGSTLALLSNTTNIEAAVSGGLLGFNKGGFSIGSDSTVNTNTDNYVAWKWKAGGVPVTNVAGSVTSTVSANPTAGFSIVNYTGTGASATVGHGLETVPSMYIVKGRDGSTYSWNMYHVKSGASPQTLYLNIDADYAAGPDSPSSLRWNDEYPTLDVFSLGGSAAVNGSGKNFIAYVFSEVPGYSKFGSYTGNGSSDGPFVYTGFKPRYLMVKQSNGSNNWKILDSTRATFNPIGGHSVGGELNMDTEGGESSYTGSNDFEVDFLSNGFKFRDTDQNSTSNTFIYAAFAEETFKYGTAGVTTVPDDAQLWFGFDF